MAGVNNSPLSLDESFLFVIVTAAARPALGAAGGFAFILKENTLLLFHNAINKKDIHSSEPQPQELHRA